MCGMDAGVANDDVSYSPEAAISRWKFAVSRRYQHLLDKSTPHALHRWIGCFVVASIYVLRVYTVQGFYIVSYGLGIYILNLLIGFLSPQVDPEIHDGPGLPTRGSDEFRPFARRLPDFKFCPIHPYYEETDITHDQIQICTVLVWETEETMEEMIDTTKKKVLIDIVRLVQKRGLKGKLGDWKEFLDNQDRKFGSNLSDPSKRSHEVLASFLKSFHEEDHLKFLFNVMQQHSNKEVLEQLKDKSFDSPEQRLVQETLQNPSYTFDYSFKALNEGWEVINLEDINKAIRYTSMVSIDCEMVSCEDGTEGLVEVCVVDRNLEVKLHERVKPNKAIADYRTDITGISSKDLDGVTCSLANIQESMKKLLSDGTILVGHSLYNDLRVLKLDHVKVIDTSFILQSMNGPIHKTPSLSSLCKAVLGYDVREKGATHSCVDDARAAMKLVLAKIEHGIKAIHLIEEPIPESEMAKLLLHGIPTSVNSEELHNVLPGDFTIELKSSKKGRGEKYSAFAIFKNPQEVLQAYENVQGNQEKDTGNRPQKLVKFKLSADKTGSLYVRKMAPNDNHDQIPSKRAFQVGDDAFVVSKKAKMDPSSNECDIDSLKNEIESLRQQLKEKDMLIESLQKQKDFGISKVHNKRVPL